MRSARSLFGFQEVGFSLKDPQRHQCAHSQLKTFATRLNRSYTVVAGRAQVESLVALYTHVGCSFPGFVKVRKGSRVASTYCVEHDFYDGNMWGLVRADGLSPSRERVWMI